MVIESLHVLRASLGFLSKVALAIQICHLCCCFDLQYGEIHALSQVVIAEPYTLPMSGSWPGWKLIIQQNSESKEELGPLCKTLLYKLNLTINKSYPFINQTKCLARLEGKKEFCFKPCLSPAVTLVPLTATKLLSKLYSIFQVRQWMHGAVVECNLTACLLCLLDIDLRPSFRENNG